MQPTLSDSDQILVNTHIYNFSSPITGDIVVFDPVQSKRKQAIKRVIGLPGEKITLRDGILYVNGDIRKEPYLKGLPHYLGLDEFSCQLEINQYFLLGDNRSHSTDSRAFGPIMENQIAGKALLRYWPVKRAVYRIK